MTQEQKAKRYDEVIKRMKHYVVDEYGCSRIKVADLFPELAESEDERIRKALMQNLKERFGTKGSMGKGLDMPDVLAWLEKQDKCKIDYPQNHQDSNCPNGSIVLEDFNGGEGFYKVHLDYLNKKQVEEIEEMIRVWNKDLKTSNENIKDCIGMCLTDVNEQRFKDYGTNLRDCLAWLEKQGEQKPLFKKGDTVIWQNEEYSILDVTTDSYNIGGYIIPIYRQNEFIIKQKLADKINPKFKIGDVITDNTGAYPHKKIEAIENENYIVRCLYTNCQQYIPINTQDEYILVEQKSAWSEEDENNILFLTSIIEECFKDKEKITLYGDTVCANFTKEDVIDRLKSLRPQNTWKPSDRQMIALSNINLTGNISYAGQEQELINLYSDLKKLREE